jgi:membrane protease YdiL (CAAX protease family)
MRETPILQPMPLGLSLGCFGIPAGIGILGLYLLLPALRRAGVPELWNYTVSFAGMFPLLLGAALIAFRLEGNTLSWTGLKQRFRIKSMGQREWRWTAGLLVVYTGGQLLLSPTAGWLASHLPLPLPDGLPTVLDPRIAKSSIPTELLGVQLQGDWGMALWYMVVLALNILGEELWWRGYILPRQELTHGRWTWLVHGLLWTFFHVPLWWNLVSLLPSTLSLSYVAWRLKNTSPGIIVHLLMNGLGFGMVLLGILGLGV